MGTGIGSLRHDWNDSGYFPFHHICALRTVLRSAVLFSGQAIVRCDVNGVLPKAKERLRRDASSFAKASEDTSTGSA